MTAPRFVVGVIGMIFRDDGHILGLKRASDSQHWAGAWECVSGKVKIGEDPLQAVQREIKEECGITVDIDPRPVDCFFATYGNEPMVLICFHCTHRNGEVALSPEHDEYAWLSIDEFGERTTLPRLKQLARTRSQPSRRKSV